VENADLKYHINEIPNFNESKAQEEIDKLSGHWIKPIDKLIEQLNKVKRILI
jgi:hypothetical protein